MVRQQKKKLGKPTAHVSSQEQWYSCQQVVPSDSPLAAIDQINDGLLDPPFQNLITIEWPGDGITIGQGQSLSFEGERIPKAYVYYLTEMREIFSFPNSPASLILRGGGAGSTTHGGNETVTVCATSLDCLGKGRIGRSTDEVVMASWAGTADNGAGGKNSSESNWKGPPVVPYQVVGMGMTAELPALRREQSPPSRRLRELRVDPDFLSRHRVRIPRYAGYNGQEERDDILGRGDAL
ncbi:hypothetical protein BJV74DRAFT_799136 [Russula compacta]|nr:hypothetical protein BJV74DRAFT_799136 [Russula compacta]